MSSHFVEILPDGGWDSRTWSRPLADEGYRAEVWQRLLANRHINESGCWEWMKYRTRDGYGVISVKQRMTTAHKVAAAIAAGGLWSNELQIDHLCRNRACFNPDHLEPVTLRENVIRGLAPTLAGLRGRSKTHCPQGHEYTVENTYVYKNTGARKCRACRAECERKRWRAA